MMLSTVLCLVFYFLSFFPFSFIIFNARHLLYRISSLFAYAPHRTHARHFRNRIQHPQHTVTPLVVPIPNAIINIVLPPCFLPSTIIIHHCRHRHLPQLFFTLSSQPARFFPPATDTVALNHVYLISLLHKPPIGIAFYDQLLASTLTHHAPLPRIRITFSSSPPKLRISKPLVFLG